MTTQTMRRERGFLDTRPVRERSATRGSGRVRNILREAGETIRGTFEAPLRYATGSRSDKTLQALDPATRRDIGV